ncbi:helix-turn-helix domain-containing protein [Metaclostridioides mangenotii]|uniref:helix-turn-helix domain-containing protein n=1 Tax=Metaclostridioides mangenotii TaxID=1540 RepID=UPI0026F21622|nr:helix-turn-helix transcriptional regulator [Clostridioides mangenotii]
MSIGHNIQKNRKGKGVTQKQLSERSSITINKISKYERNEIIPSNEDIKKIASSLEISTEDIVQTDKIPKYYLFANYILEKAMDYSQINNTSIKDSVYSILIEELIQNQKSEDRFINFASENRADYIKGNHNNSEPQYIIDKKIELISKINNNLYNFDLLSLKMILDISNKFNF